jgi:hypothetical protein
LSAGEAAFNALRMAQKAKQEASAFPKTVLD